MLTQKGITIPRSLKPEQEQEGTPFSFRSAGNPHRDSTRRVFTLAWETGDTDAGETCCVPCHLMMFVACPLSELSGILLWILSRSPATNGWRERRPFPLGMILPSSHPLTSFYRNFSYHLSETEPPSNLLPASSTNVEKKKLLERFHPPANKGALRQPFAVAMAAAR